MPNKQIKQRYEQGLARPEKKAFISHHKGHEEGPEFLLYKFEADKNMIQFPHKTSLSDHVESDLRRYHQGEQ